VLAHALREAYRDVLHHDGSRRTRCGSIAPRLVDVNVHPQKTECGFRDSGAVHQAVRAAIERALSAPARRSRRFAARARRAPGDRRDRVAGSATRRVRRA
jgi:DNA mismatch repair protein MutL